MCVCVCVCVCVCKNVKTMMDGHTQVNRQTDRQTSRVGKRTLRVNLLFKSLQLCCALFDEVFISHEPLEARHQVDDEDLVWVRLHDMLDQTQDPFQCDVARLLLNELRHFLEV